MLVGSVQTGVVPRAEMPPLSSNKPSTAVDSLEGLVFIAALFVFWSMLDGFGCTLSSEDCTLEFASDAKVELPLEPLAVSSEIGAIVVSSGVRSS